MVDFKLPEIGEGVVEGEIVRWLKAPGDTIAANEALVEVMTDKATIELPSPIAGRLVEIKAEVGAVCAIDAVIAVIEPGAVASSAPKASPSAAPPAPKASQSAAVAPVLATPAARALAREEGIDLRGLPVDDRGRITKSDVLRAREAPARPTTAAPVAAAAPVASAPQRPTPAAPVAAALSDGDEVLPFRGMRRRIAEGMVKSYTSAVHYTYVEQINVTRLVKLRDDAAAVAAEQG